MVETGLTQLVRNCPALSPDAAALPNLPFSITITSSPSCIAVSAALSPERPPPAIKSSQLRFSPAQDGGEKGRTSSSYAEAKPTSEADMRGLFPTSNLGSSSTAKATQSVLSPIATLEQLRPQAR